ncbi:MAG: hypothetical protein HYX97_05810 [Chloroflexi bacterium]|nr:hypothetical protein [Chloroflexota bacterium]
MAHLTTKQVWLLVWLGIGTAVLTAVITIFFAAAAASPGQEGGFTGWAAGACPLH